MNEDLAGKEAEVDQLIELLDRARPTLALRIVGGADDDSVFCGRVQNMLRSLARTGLTFEWLGYCALDSDSELVAVALLRVEWGQVKMNVECWLEQTGLSGDVWGVGPRSAEVADFAVDLLAACSDEVSGCVCFSSGAWPLAVLLPFPVAGSNEEEDRGGVFL